MKLLSSELNTEIMEQLELLHGLVNKMETMATKLDDLSGKFDDHVGQCDQQDLRNVQHQGKRRVIQSGEQSTVLADQDSNNRRRYRCSTKENEEESLRRSLQQNIVLLVEQVPCSISLLRDMLISHGCISENENQEIGKGCEKDQIRNIVLLLKGRSFEVMQAFLDCLQEVCPHVVAKIRSSYDQNIKKYDVKPKCGYCRLKRSVDLKFLADHVWSIGAIDDLVYHEINMGKRSLGDLWESFSQECNKSPLISDVMDKIRCALKEKGVYNSLVSKLEAMSQLKCTCGNGYMDKLDNKEQPLAPTTKDADDRSSSPTTASPKSSVCTEHSDTSRHASDLESEEEPVSRRCRMSSTSACKRSSWHLGSSSAIDALNEASTVSNTDVVSHENKYSSRKSSHIASEWNIFNVYSSPKRARPCSSII